MQQNDIGSILKLRVLQSDGTEWDISTATTKTIYIKTPSGTVNTYPASFFTDGTDGIISHVWASGELAESGEYQAQGFIINGSYELFTTIHRFSVGSNLSAT